MTWTKLSEEISNEYDQDPARFLAKSSSQRAYLGEGSNIYRKIKQHPYLSLVKDKHLFNQQSWGGYSQSTLRAILYISEMEKYFSPWHISHVTDFGPGYGNFTRVWDDLFGGTNFYQLVDLPNLHKISADYLAMHGMVEYIFHKTVDTMLNASVFGGKSLFFASHSLNECPMEVRNKIEETLPDYDYVYFVYNDRFDDINNLKYFEKLADRLPHETYIYEEESTAKWRLVGINDKKKSV